MTQNEETVLVALQLCIEKKKDTQPIYSHFASQGRVDDLIEALICLEKKGFVTVPMKAWVRGDQQTEDVVMTAVRLTPVGKRLAEVMVRKRRESV